MPREKMPLMSATEVMLTAEEKRLAATELHKKDVLGHNLNVMSSEVSARYALSNYLVGTPTKSQVSKRLKRQVYKTSGLQNVWLQKNIHIYILYLWLVEIRRFCCSHVCRQSNGTWLIPAATGGLSLYRSLHWYSSFAAENRSGADSAETQSQQLGKGKPNPIKEAT
jgi:hypothetical protein